MCKFWFLGTSKGRSRTLTYSRLLCNFTRVLFLFGVFVARRAFAEFLAGNGLQSTMVLSERNFFIDLFLWYLVA